MAKIHFFINTVSSGGAEHQLSVLANLLCKRNHEVCIATFGRAEDYYPLDERIKRVRLDRFSSKILRYINISLFFLKLKSDWVITFGVRESFLSIPALLFNSRVKIIAGERNITLQKKTIYEIICHNLLYRRATYIVPNSNSQTSYLRSNFPNLTKKLVTITNYTDLSLYQPMEYSVVSHRLVIFARYYPQKNWYRFAEAVSMLKNQIGSSFVIDCYGSQKFSSQVLQNYYDGLVSLIEKYEIGDVLRLHDSIKNVAEEMNKSDAICLPSLYEGFSNTISEAICCGKPVICSDVADNSVMVHDGENGFLFNPLDVKDIAYILKKFFECSSEEKRLMGLKSRKIAESLFSEEKFVSAYEQLLNTL